MILLYGIKLQNFTLKEFLKNAHSVSYILLLTTFLTLVHIFIWIFCKRTCFIYFKLDSVYTVPDPQGHDIKLNTFKTSVALKFMIVLQNLTTINRRNNGRVEYDRKSTKLGVVTARIRYCVYKRGLSVTISNVGSLTIQSRCANIFVFIHCANN